MDRTLTSWWTSANPPLFAGSDQPARRSFGIRDIRIGDGRVPVIAQSLATTPFATLVGFARADATGQPSILVVPPLSGHFAILLRDLVVGLLPDFSVLVLDWTNVRHVPVRHGRFGFDDNIATIMRMIRRQRSGLAVIGVCQGGVPALAATALLAAAADRATPAALVLIGTPIDPLARPTPVVHMLRERSLAWFEAAAVPVLEAYAGAGRLVYPARLQLSALLSYRGRKLREGGELLLKARQDDGADPCSFPFFDLYSSIMDLDAMHFVENIDRVFHAGALRTGSLRLGGDPVDPRAIRNTALLTVEGGEDDIAAPGQASAAHGLCTGLPAALHGTLVVTGAGHFSLFHGGLFRREVLPVLQEFCGGRCAAH